jgi:hypothetical protein
LPTRYDERGHVDYPHHDGCLIGCPPCDEIMAAEEASELDEETLTEMVKVYMTDKGCAAAVERLEAGGLSRLAAARTAAKNVVPAPHNIAAHDARYLLAPEAVTVDDERLDDEFVQAPSLEEVLARSSAPGEWVRPEHILPEEIDGIGPVPPHPQEQPEDRQVFVSVVHIDLGQYEEMMGRPKHEHECSALCDGVHDLEDRVSAAGRIPLAPPTITVSKVRADSYRVRIVMDTVPARGRSATTGVFLGTAEQVQRLIDHYTEGMESRPNQRLMIRRKPGESWATAAIYGSKSQAPQVPQLNGAYMVSIVPREDGGVEFAMESVPDWMSAVVQTLFGDQG